MRFEFLKRGMRIEERIVIFERDDHTERHAIILHAVNPAAAIQIGAERPAERVRHVAGVDPSRLHIPEFLDSDAVDLRVEAVELQPVDELFGQ